MLIHGKILPVDQLREPAGYLAGIPDLIKVLDSRSHHLIAAHLKNVCEKMKTTVKAIALVLFSLPLVACAAGKVATNTMQVSFVVKESCNVQSTTTASAKTPAVACQLNTPYQMTRSADKAAATSSSDTALAIRPEAGAQDWTITF